MLEKHYEFSRSNSEKNLINYLDRFALCFIFIFPILIILLDFPVEKATYVGIFYALVMLPLIYIYRIHHRNFAYRITFDFNKNTVFFDMLRNKGTISAKTSDIDKIVIKYFITFFVKDKKIKYKYRDQKGKELAKFLKEKLKAKVEDF